MVKYLSRVPWKLGLKLSSPFVFSRCKFTRVGQLDIKDYILSSVKYTKVRERDTSDRLIAETFKSFMTSGKVYILCFSHCHWKVPHLQSLVLDSKLKFSTWTQHSRANSIHLSIPLVLFPSKLNCTLKSSIVSPECDISTLSTPIYKRSPINFQRIATIFQFINKLWSLKV